MSTVSSLEITAYIADGVKKVADIAIWDSGIKGDNRWLFKNIDETLLYSDHRSWVYFIVCNTIIHKVGETGQPLGIRCKTHSQPKSGTKSRMGRLANHIDEGPRYDTDVVIREELYQKILSGGVSLWALQCPIDNLSITCGGNTKIVPRTIHKHVETMYLDHIKESFGDYPALNKCRK